MKVKGFKTADRVIGSDAWAENADPSRQWRAEERRIGQPKEEEWRPVPPKTRVGF